MSLIFIGVVAGAHGTLGAMHFEPSPDTPAAFVAGAPVYLGFSSSFTRKFTLTTWKYSPSKVIFSVAGVTNPEQAQTFFDYAVFVEESAARKYYRIEYTIADVIGCTALDTISGKNYGVISDVWKLPANDVWVISGSSGECSVPVVDEFVHEVDVSRKTVFLTLPEGYDEAFRS